MMNGDTLLGRLCDQLRDETALHRELLNLGERKRDALVANDLDAFRAVVADEGAVVQRMVALRRRRDGLLAVAAERLGSRVRDLRLATLLDHADAVLREEFLRLQSELQEVLARLRRVNDNNFGLMRTHLGLVHDLIDVVTGGGDHAAYDRNGRAGERRHRQGGIVNMAC